MSDNKVGREPDSAKKDAPTGSYADLFDISLEDGGFDSDAVMTVCHGRRRIFK